VSYLLNNLSANYAKAEMLFSPLWVNTLASAESRRVLLSQAL